MIYMDSCIVLVIVIFVMDLGLLYGDFVMDNMVLTLHTTADGSGVFRDDAGLTHCTIRPFRDGDPDIERDPLSTNWRLFDSRGVEILGSMVVAGPTKDAIYVLVPDSTTFTADDICPTDLQHVIGLRLDPAENLSAILPREDLHLSLCESSLHPTLIADRRVYWAEVIPLLQRWLSVNDTHCHRVIRVNMSRHLRASHTDNQCFWHCPVSTGLIWREFIAFARDRGARFTRACAGTEWSGLGRGVISTSVNSPARPYGWTSRWLANPNSRIIIS